MTVSLLGFLILLVAQTADCIIGAPPKVRIPQNTALNPPRSPSVGPAFPEHVQSSGISLDSTPIKLPNRAKPFAGRDIRYDILMGLTEGVVFELSKLLCDFVLAPTGVRISHALNSQQDEVSYLVRGILQEITLNLVSPVATSLDVVSQIEPSTSAELESAKADSKTSSDSKPVLAPVTVSLLVELTPSFSLTPSVVTTYSPSAHTPSSSPQATATAASSSSPPDSTASLMPTLGILSHGTPCLGGPCPLVIDSEQQPNDKEPAALTSIQPPPIRLPMAMGPSLIRGGLLNRLLRQPPLLFRGLEQDKDQDQEQDQDQEPRAKVASTITPSPRVRTKDSERRRFRVATVVILRSFVAPLLLHSLGHSLPSFLGHELIEEVEVLVDEVGE